MPELPEVETTVNFLKKKITGQKIINVWSDYQSSKFSFCRGFVNFKKELIGKRIIKISRRAKNILFELNDKKILLIHQKMTGHLLFGKWRKCAPTEKWKSLWIPVSGGVLSDAYNDYIHLMIFLSNGWQIAMSDLRKFGKVKIYGSIIEIDELKALGPEPLGEEFTWKILQDSLKNINQAIKKVLLDQRVISGIGNIYSDDILWCAKIHPLRKAKTLKETEVKNIFTCVKKILKEAVDCGGTSIQDYRQPTGEKGYYQEKRKVYKKEGELCKRCKKGIIKRIKIGGRSSCFCPVCQK